MRENRKNGGNIGNIGNIGNPPLEKHAAFYFTRTP